MAIKRASAIADLALSISFQSFALECPIGGSAPITEAEVIRVTSQSHITIQG